MIFTHIYDRFLWPAIALIVALTVGTVGYLIIGGPGTSVVDALYMTFITIATIGYGEIIDMTGRPGARIFTMLIAFAGIGVTTYIFSKVTAFIVAGELNEALRRRKMLKRIAQLSGHYIVCGAGRIGSIVINELEKNRRPYVLMDIDPEKIRASTTRYENADTYRATAPKMRCSNKPASSAQRACSRSLTMTAAIWSSRYRPNNSIRIAGWSHVAMKRTISPRWRELGRMQSSRPTLPVAYVLCPRWYARMSFRSWMKCFTPTTG